MNQRAEALADHVAQLAHRNDQLRDALRTLLASLAEADEKAGHGMIYRLTHEVDAAYAALEGGGR